MPAPRRRPPVSASRRCSATGWPHRRDGRKRLQARALPVVAGRGMGPDRQGRCRSTTATGSAGRVRRAARGV